MTSAQPEVSPTALSQPAIFTTDGESFVPTPLARGPWGDFISGQYVGGLLTTAIENLVDDPDSTPARVTIDMPRRVRLEPVTVRTTVLRQGARITLVDATMIQGPDAVAHARVMWLRRGEQAPNEVWTSPIDMPSVPESPPTTSAGAPSHGVIYNAGEPGIPGADLDSWANPSQKFIWLTYTAQLVAGSELTPLTRAVMVADSTSAVTNYGTTGLHFINADYTVALARLPEGPSIGIAGLTHYSSDGTASGSGTLFDKHGPFGSALTVGIANSGFHPRRHEENGSVATGE